MAEIIVALDLVSGPQSLLDLEWHDIPNTVRSAVAAAKDLDVRMATVHALSGREMMGAAASAAGSDLGLVAVTVLTSHDDRSYEMTLGRTEVNLEEEVIRQSRNAIEAGLRSVVCSPLEVRSARGVVKTPGWIVVLLAFLLPGSLGAQAFTQGQPDTGLRGVADRAAMAMASQNPSDLAGDASQLLIQLPGVKPSGAVDRAQALAMLRGFFEGTDEVETRVTGSRTVSPELGVVELMRRYRTRGTQTVREQMILLGYRRGGGVWMLVEVRIE